MSCLYGLWVAGEGVMPAAQQGVISKETKVNLGLGLVALGGIVTAIWQFAALRDDLRLRDMEHAVDSADLSGEIAVLGEKVDALDGRVQYVTEDLRSQISQLRTEVKEIVKRNP